MDFIQLHWLTVISLAVALIGGVPGIVTVFSAWKARPKLAAYITNMMPIKGKDTWGESLTGLILHIIIGNEGKEPLVPITFQLECKINGKWINFKTSSIPEGFIVNGPDSQHIFTNVIENDIQKRNKSITRESPVYGFFSFVSKEVDFDELNIIYTRMPIKLKCVDLFGQTHEMILNKDFTQTTHIDPDLSPGKGVKVSINENKTTQSS